MDSTTPAAPPLGARAVLGIREFRLLWLAQVISDFGDSLTNLALLIFVNQVTGSTAALATMAIVLALPQVTFGLLAGVYVDRWNRKRVMIVSDLLRGVLVLGFVGAVLSDQLWLMFVLGFVQSAIGTFFTPARGALMPNLVPRDGLLAANSLTQISRIVAGVAGTAAAGAVIGIAGLVWPVFIVDALTFFASALLVSRIVAPSPARRARCRGPPPRHFRPVDRRAAGDRRVAGAERHADGAGRDHAGAGRGQRADRAADRQRPEGADHLVRRHRTGPDGLDDPERRAGRRCWLRGSNHPGSSVSACS